MCCLGSWFLDVHGGKLCVRGVPIFLCFGSLLVCSVKEIARIAWSTGLFWLQKVKLARKFLVYSPKESFSYMCSMYGIFWLYIYHEKISAIFHRFGACWDPSRLGLAVAQLCEGQPGRGMAGTPKWDTVEVKDQQLIKLRFVGNLMISQSWLGDNIYLSCNWCELRMNNNAGVLTEWTQWCVMFAVAAGGQ